MVDSVFKTKCAFCGKEVIKENWRKKVYKKYYCCREHAIQDWVASGKNTRFQNGHGYLKKTVIILPLEHYSNAGHKYWNSLSKQEREERVKKFIESGIKTQYKKGKKVESWRLKKILKSNFQKPNKAELKLNTLLQKNFQNEWKYVGNGEFILGGKCPDFLNVNGKKLLIELFSDWHTEKLKGDNYKYQDYFVPEKRIDFFKQFGFKTLIIWDKELKEDEKVVNKVKEFIGDSHG